jgi:outer membrane lipoprotein-sorting protein
MKKQRRPSCLMIATACAAVTSYVAVPTDALHAAPSPMTSPATTPRASQSDAAAREIAAFAGTWAGVTGYSATVTIFDQKGTQTQNLVFDYTFRKPSSVTVRVVAGPNAGVTLTWDGGTTVVARRGSGLAALFKRTLSLHDPQVTTLRGSSIDQLSFGAILAHGQQQAGSLSEAPGEAIDGVAVNAVTLVPAGSASDAGLTREVVELSTVTHLPVRVLAYDGPTLVRRIDFSNVKVQA